ncbi:MAG TPA: hypothetical protein VEF05_05730 [Terriglobales bacterium]|nr:hypothetical protein [Terriglobales bacterium]
MYQETVQNELLVTLTHSYEEDPDQFVTVPKPVLDSSMARLAMAELRNDGYLEEQIRGVVRLTASGYEKFRKN